MTNAKAYDSLTSCLGLGVGIDLPWGEKIGFQTVEQRDQITSRVRQFLQKHAHRFNYLFFAFQPRDRQKLVADKYFSAYDDLFAAAEGISVRALHQTTLNMGSMEYYDRSAVAQFTNRIASRYGIKWIVEDIGIWSMRGKIMPYPLPPLLTRSGLEACIRNVKECKSMLDTPLCIEFPGFTDGSNFYIGTICAFDFFNELANEADVSVTLDIGHILSYQWLVGRRGDKMFEHLSRLPLGRCFEFHLSGCSVINGRFRDAHHGILLDEQLTLLKYLLPLCRNLRAVTYEDPKFGDDGSLIPKSVKNFAILQAIIERWKVARDMLATEPVKELWN